MEAHSSTPIHCPAWYSYTPPQLMLCCLFSSTEGSDVNHPPGTHLPGGEGTTCVSWRGSQSRAQAAAPTRWNNSDEHRVLHTHEVLGLCQVKDTRKAPQENLTAS